MGTLVLSNTEFSVTTKKSHDDFEVRQPPVASYPFTRVTAVHQDGFASTRTAYFPDNVLDEEAQKLLGNLPGLPRAPYHDVLKAAGVADYYLNLSLGDLVRLFYTEMACAIQTEQYPVFRERIKPFADMIALGLYISCAGEVRYVMHKYLHTVIRLRNKVNKKRRKWFENTPTYRFAVRLGAGPTKDWLPVFPLSSGSVSRERVGASISTGWQHRIVSDRKGLESDFRIMARVFALARTTRGYAGPSWGYGAEIGRQYFAGEISAASFVDMTFDQVHNGAAILSKAWFGNHYSSCLQDWLYYKKHASPEDLAQWAPNHIREIYGLPPTPFVLPSEVMRYCIGTMPKTPKYFWDNSVSVPEERLSVLWHRKWFALPFNPVDAYPGEGYSTMVSSVGSGDVRLRRDCEMYFGNKYTEEYLDKYRTRGMPRHGRCTVKNCPYNTKLVEAYAALYRAKLSFDRAEAHHQVYLKETNPVRKARLEWALSITSALRHYCQVLDNTVQVVDPASAYQALQGKPVPEGLSFEDLDNPDLFKINLE